MNDPDDFRGPLAELRESVEARRADHATTQARALVTELDPSFAPPDPLGLRDPLLTARFSGLRHALLREIRSVERHIAHGDWSHAAKAVHGAIELLPRNRPADSQATTHWHRC